MPNTPREGETQDQPRSTEERLAKLAALRESGEIEKQDYNTNRLLWFIEFNAPLTAADSSQIRAITNQKKPMAK